MGQTEIQHGKEPIREPIRIFKSDFMEFFTHIHPLVIVAIWAPVMLYFLIGSIIWRVPQSTPVYIPLGFAIGLVVWTFAEYSLHRFVFHFRPRSEFQKRILFLSHGIHHAQPMSKTRLVMPPVVSIPLSIFFYGIFYLCVAIILGRSQWVAPVYSGFAAGYLTYDLLHYSMHHFRMKGAYLQFIRKFHMRHHAQTPDKRFGVSSPIWDLVFGTRPETMP